MEVLLGGQRVQLTDSDLIGAGGEAQVFRHEAWALKVFHPVDPSLRRKERAQALAQLEAKRKKLEAFPPGLPAPVISPVHLLRDLKGAVAGYAMPRVDGADDLLRLGQRSFREGVVTNAEVVSLFRKLRAALASLHSQRVVVGDLNDSNVLFRGDEPFLIDADSMQFAAFPCAVGHERFLDPLLYGKDLAAAPLFTPGSDWYAFAVALFASLLYVHPFGGTHPKLPTLLRRAEARHSVLRPDVRYPRGAAHWKVLPDSLLGLFEQVFERDRRAPLPERALDLTWTRCRCGTEHARATCPDCASLPSGPVRSTTVHNGRCRAQLLLQTTGRVLAASMQGQGGLRFLYEEDGVLRREDRTEVPWPGQSPARFALAGLTTWVGDSHGVIAFRGGRATLRASASANGRAASFDAWSGGALFVQGDWLVTHDGARLGKVLGGQTWLRTGERLSFGFYRAGLCTFFFLVNGHRPGLREVSLPPLQGRLIDAGCAFDDGGEQVLFSVATEKDGVRTHAVSLIGEDGSLLARREGAPDSDRVVASIRGKALVAGRPLTLTDDGLLSLNVDRANARLQEGTLFPDTRPFVSVDARLLAAPGGAAIVVAPGAITQLSLIT